MTTHQGKVTINVHYFISVPNLGYQMKIQVARSNFWWSTVTANTYSGNFVFAFEKATHLACKHIRAFSSHRSDTVNSSCSSAMAFSHAGCGTNPTPDSINFLITSSVTQLVSDSVLRTSSNHLAWCKI